MEILLGMRNRMNEFIGRVVREGVWAVICRRRSVKGRRGVGVDV